jgi:NAD+ synthase
MKQQTREFSRDVLHIDPKSETERICQFIRQSVAKTFRKKGAVVALSGGIDSSVTAALCVRALGKERVTGLLLPERESSQETIDLSNLVADKFGIEKVCEDITGILEAAGCYQKRDEAFRKVLPEYTSGYKAKIVLPNILEEGGYNLFFLVAHSPQGKELRKRLTYDAYLGIVAASNFKQRVRAMLTYHHADRRNYLVAGTSNLLEHDQGFFVKLGDGAADLKPITHLYKSQIYQLADHLEIPKQIRKRPPTPDTYPLSQTAQEFYFSIPLETYDLCVYAEKHDIPADRVSAVLNLTEEQVQRILANIKQKRSATDYLRQTVSLL